jgi:hypothetical protein
MLSSVLRSARAVRVNVEIMRAFVRLRHAAPPTDRLRDLPGPSGAGGPLLFQLTGPEPGAHHRRVVAEQNAIDACADPSVVA